MNLEEFVFYSGNKNFTFSFRNPNNIGKKYAHLIKYAVGDESCGVALNEDKSLLFAVLYTRTDSTVQHMMFGALDYYNNLTKDSDIIDGLFHSGGISKLVYENIFYTYIVYYYNGKRNGIYFNARKNEALSFFKPDNIKADEIDYDYELVAQTKPTMSPFHVQKFYKMYRYNWKKADVTDFCKSLNFYDDGIPQENFIKTFLEKGFYISRTVVDHPNHRSCILFTETFVAFNSLKKENDSWGFRNDLAYAIMYASSEYYGNKGTIGQIKFLKKYFDEIKIISFSCLGYSLKKNISQNLNYFVDLCYKIYYLTVRGCPYGPIFPEKMEIMIKCCPMTLTYEFDCNLAARAIKEDKFNLKTGIFPKSF